ncbi:family 16 glycoside hydrolase [Sabulibacter ruber]|uniref:family 16 glycoside hydrolase n=1 Tax=Sabulibacter ruber TaxID=2811901 RepID=UPI001A9718EC|nr:family 16 glycoside hydrolase [Sabulibacter ruber]
MKNVLLGLAFASLTANAQVELKRDFLPATWQLPAGQSSMVHYLGQESLYLSKGVALYGDGKYHEGIIEVDIADDDAQGEAGIVFRHTSDGAYRGITLDLHALNSPDTAHPTATALKQNASTCTPHASKPASWTHLKIIIQDNVAQVFLNDAPEPASEIKLPPTKKPVKGRIGLMASGGAYFSNFKYSPLPSASIVARN